MIFLCQSLKIHPEDRVCTGAAPSGGLNSTVKNGLCFIRNNQILVGNQLKTKACTVGAGAGRIVKGKHSGLQLRKADSAVLTGIVLRKIQFLSPVRQMDNDQTAGMGTGRFDGICNSPPLTFPNHQSVNNQLNGMFFVFFKGNLFTEIIQNSVYTYTNKALLASILKHFNVLAFSIPNDRRKYHKTSPLSQRFHSVYNLINGLFYNLFSALGTVGYTYTRPQEPEIIIYFRDRTNRGTGIL